MNDSNTTLEKSEPESTISTTVIEAKESISSTSINLKRSRDTNNVEEETVNNSEDSEPEEKRPSFRLNPPTLIHGQAKSNPVLAEPEATFPKRNFLRPSKLTAPSSHTPAVPTPSNGQASVSENMGFGTASVSSSNPFLIPPVANKEGGEQEESVFGSNMKDKLKVNGSSNFNKSNDVASSGEANPFLQPGGEENTEDGEFVFGSNMGERVVKSEADSTFSDLSNSKPSMEDSPAATEFIFGKNLAKRAKVNSNEQSNAVPLTASASNTFLSADSTKTSSDEVSSNGNKDRKLEEDAAAMYAASNERNVMPHVEVLTGEENERNVLQVPCKLYHFCKTSAKYLERGQGYLRLNDQHSQDVDTDQAFQSRLVMRTHGSLRLVLNLKIWSQMLVEKASQKSVRIKTFSDGTANVYLISATVNDAEQLYRAVEYRVLHLKQIEESKNNNNKASAETESNNADSQASIATTDSTTDTTTQPRTTDIKEIRNATIDSTETEQPTSKEDPKV